MNENTKNYIEEIMRYINNSMEKVERLIELEEEIQSYYHLSDQTQDESDEALLHLNNAADLLQDAIAELEMV